MEPEAGGTRRRSRTDAWLALAEKIVEASRASHPREVTYWAQQLAFSPVVPHALSAWLHGRTPAPADREALAGTLLLGLSGLDALPEEPGSSASRLSRLASRQAASLSLLRRTVLGNILGKLGFAAESRIPGKVPDRMTRPYPLIGWTPPR